MSDMNTYFRTKALSLVLDPDGIEKAKEIMVEREKAKKLADQCLVIHAAQDEVARLQRRLENYEKNLSAWKDDRHAVGKTASQQFPGLLGKLGRLLMQRAVAPTMEEWELEHPRPIPPWQDTP